ncbi:MAG: orotidine-5'-phosphate decarboxylase [Planctomycetota bacterium]|jgi:orotidine-5'-phosphate decarboxylase
MKYADRLEAALIERGNPCLVGLDPHLDLLPEEFAIARDESAPRAERARAVEEFLLGIIELAAGRVPAVKPQSAFFERLGADGAVVWERVVAEARRAGLLVIGDVKRSDIASTARAYGQAFLEDAGEACCDAITVNPYLGADSIEPLVEVCERSNAGLYVLVRTSNPGSALFQNHGNPPLTQVVADEVERWGSSLRGECGLSSIGAVVGATHPAELAELRERMPHTPLLIPGYGAQGAGATETISGFLPGGRGALVNSSRGILYAWRKPENRDKHWKDASLEAIETMIAEFREALSSPA